MIYDMYKLNAIFIYSIYNYINIIYMKLEKGKYDLEIGDDKICNNCLL